MPQYRHPTIDPRLKEKKKNKTRGREERGIADQRVARLLNTVAVEYPTRPVKLAAQLNSTAPRAEVQGLLMRQVKVDMGRSYRLE